MKRILSFMLAVIMILSFTVCAFAAEGDEKEVAEEDKQLEACPMPKDVTIPGDEDGKIKLASLLDIPDEAKDEARAQVQKVIARGYAIRSGFGIWTDDKGISFCTIKISQKDMPDGGSVFVNGEAVQLETKDDDGYYYFDVPLKNVMIVLIALPKTVPAGGSDDTASSSGGGASITYYGSPTFKG